MSEIDEKIKLQGAKIRSLIDVTAAPSAHEHVPQSQLGLASPAGPTDNRAEQGGGRQQQIQPRDTVPGQD